MEKINVTLKWFYIKLILIFAFILFTYNVSAANVQPQDNSIVRIKITKKNGNEEYITGFAVGKEKSAKRFVGSKSALDDYKKIEILLAGNENIELALESTSNVADVAIFSLKSSPVVVFKPLKLGDAGKIKNGQGVVLRGFSEDIANAQFEVISGIVSSVDSGNAYRCFSISGEIPNKSYHGGPVFNSKGAVVGIITYSSNKDRTDIVHINYAESLLNGEYISQEAGFNTMLLMISGAAVILIGVIAIIFIVMKNKKQNNLSQKEAPIDHSDGKTMAIVPGSSTSKSKAVGVSGIGITGVSGYFAGKKFAVSKHIIIGRDPKKAKIIFPDKTQGVSAVHCELRNSGGMLMLCDLGSSYGTFLANGTKLQPSMPYAVNVGDEFYLGSADNKFRITE